MSSKPSLSALMKRAAHGPSPEPGIEVVTPIAPIQSQPSQPAPTIALVPPAPMPAPVPVAPRAEIAPKARGRNAKKPLSVWVTPEARRTLRQLAAEQDRTIESLISEGLNDLFQKYQKPRLA